MIELFQLSRGVQRQHGGTFIAVVDDLKALGAVFAKTDDLVVGQRRMAAIDMADDIGAGFQHHIGVDQPRSRDRRAAGMDRALNAVFARPADHLPRGLAVLDGPKANLAQKLDARIGQILEILLDQPVFDHRRPGMDLDPRGAEIFVPALGSYRHGFQPDDILGAARHMHFARRNQRGDTAVQGAVDPVKLLLARGIVADHRVNVAVDQAGDQRDAVGVNLGRRAFGIEFFGTAPIGDLAVDGDQAIAVQGGGLDLARQDHADIADDEFLRGCVHCGLIRREGVSLVR